MCFYRCVTCFPDTTGYLVGSIEGRVAVHHVEDQLQSKNFTFKCHRDGNDIYAVNTITFHPTFGTFVTAGLAPARPSWPTLSMSVCLSVVVAADQTPAHPAGLRLLYESCCDLQRW
jgi:hypothetical protein